MASERKKVFLVYNPRSSQHERIETEVTAKLRKQAGILLGKFAVAPTDVDENASRLARLLTDGDVVVAAGGDGTAAIALNGCMLSGKRVGIAVLPYGNFNDVARALGRAGGRMVFPMEVAVDGERWRWAASYVTVGMLARSVAVFDEKAERKVLQRGGDKLVYSIGRLARWYFGHRKEAGLPGFKLNGVEVRKGTTDYLAVNGWSVARVMRGGEEYLSRRGFRGGTQRLGRLMPLLWFMGRSMLKRVPGESSRHDLLEFLEPATVTVQAEGEYATFSGVERLEVRKCEKGLKIVEKSSLGL